MEGDRSDYIGYVIREATDEVVGDGCMNVVVPPTVANDLQFREIYSQGYRHAIADVRNAVREKYL